MQIQIMYKCIKVGYEGVFNTWTCLCDVIDATDEPPHGKINVVFEQVRHKPACTVREEG